MRAGHHLRRASSRTFSMSIIGAAATLLFPGAVLYAQPAGTYGVSPTPAIAPAAVGEVNPLVGSSRQLVCGDLTQAGTPIAGNALGANNAPGGGDDGTSGNITIAGIPATATVRKATLYWTVLTTNDESSPTGASITFNGSGVLGVKMGTAGTTPCFPDQDNTIAWKADVTALVPSPGNGVYTVAGFPGGNELSGPHFTEGATLQVMWTTDNTALRWINSYEAPAGAGNLFVSPGSGNTISQLLSWPTAAGGPTSGKLYEVIGNGQNSVFGEDLSVTGGAGTVTFDDTLDGSTGAKAAGSCSYTDDSITECFWDDDVQDISGAILAGDTSVTFNYGHQLDCHDFPALALSVKSNVSFDAYCTAGGAFVDAQCPAAGPLGGGEWKNHGDYVSCVAHAANTYLLNNATVCSTSCIVNPRARSDVGKKGGNPD